MDFFYGLKRERNESSKAIRINWSGWFDVYNLKGYSTAAAAI